MDAQADLGIHNSHKRDGYFSYGEIKRIGYGLVDFLSLLTKEKICMTSSLLSYTTPFWNEV